MSATEEISDIEIVDNSIQIWRVAGCVLAGVLIWLLIGAVVRVGMIVFDHFGVEKTYVGTLIREFTATYAGSFGAISFLKKYLNDKSHRLYSFIFVILLGTFLFGGLAFYSFWPGIPFSLFDGVWYASAGCGAVAGVWYARFEN